MKKPLILIGILVFITLITGCKSAPPEPVIIETPLPAPAPTPDPTSVPTPTPERPYYIEILPPMTDKEYIINPYSFINSFYTTVFHDFRLTNLISLEERREIMKTIYDELLPGSQVNFVIKEYLGVDKLFFVFYIEFTRQGIICELKTNWDEGAGVLVPLDMPREEWKRCVTKSYYLINEKLVHKNDMYSLYRETTFKENNDIISLAHMYIFDEDEENDSQVESLLEKIITRNPGNIPGFRAEQELVYYLLLHNQVQRAEAIVLKAVELLDDPEMARLKQEFEITGEEIKVLSVLNSY